MPLTFNSMVLSPLKIISYIEGNRVPLAFCGKRLLLMPALFQFTGIACSRLFTSETWDPGCAKPIINGLSTNLNT